MGEMEIKGYIEAYLRAMYLYRYWSICLSALKSTISIRHLLVMSQILKNDKIEPEKPG